MLLGLGAVSTAMSLKWARTKHSCANKEVIKVKELKGCKEVERGSVHLSEFDRPLRREELKAGTAGSLFNSGYWRRNGCNLLMCKSANFNSSHWSCWNHFTAALEMLLINISEKLALKFFSFLVFTRTHTHLCLNEPGTVSRKLLM